MMVEEAMKLHAADRRLREAATSFGLWQAATPRNDVNIKGTEEALVRLRIAALDYARAAGLE